MAKTETKTETLNRLFLENGLLKEDWFEHSQYRIITRSGIEKIQGKNRITVSFEAVTMTPSFCVVKARACKEELFCETFGSAGFQADGQFPKGKAFQYLYFPEMAEKRALSRVVLKLSGLYQLGVFSEDESEDFKPGKPQAEASKPVSATPAPSAPVDDAPHKHQVLVALATAPNLDALKTLWRMFGPRFGLDNEVIEAKEKRKADLQLME